MLRDDRSALGHRDLPVIGGLPHPLSRARIGPRRYERHVPMLARLALDPDAVDVNAQQPVGFARAAVFHGVAGPVLRAARAGRITIAAPAHASLESTHAVSMVLASLLRSEIAAISRVAARAAGATPVLIKGPAVSDRFYDDREDRVFADLDFLLPRSSIDAAEHALSAELGYRPVAQRWPANLERHAHAVELTRRRGVHTLAIELHWRISDDPAARRLDHASVAGRAEPWAGDPAVLVPDPAVQLLLLAVHLLHHHDSPLHRLIDIRRIARVVDEPTWREAFALAETFGLGWLLHAALDDTERVLGGHRPRPLRSPAPPPWGPLRVSRLLPERPFGYHVGQLLTLRWEERPGYLITGLTGVVRRAISPAAEGDRA